MTNFSYKQIYKNCKYSFNASNQSVKVTFDWYIIPYGKTEEEFQQRRTASGYIYDGKLDLWWDGGGGTLYYQE